MEVWQDQFYRRLRRWKEGGVALVELEAARYGCFIALHPAAAQAQQQQTTSNRENSDDYA